MVSLLYLSLSFDYFHHHDCVSFSYVISLNHSNTFDRLVLPILSNYNILNLASPVRYIIHHCVTIRLRLKHQKPRLEGALEIVTACSKIKISCRVEKILG